MKKVQLIAMAAPLLLACTPEVPALKAPSESHLKAGGVLPVNPQNPYDRYGAIRNRILDSVLAHLPSPVSDSQLLKIVHDIASADDQFQSMKTPSYTPLSVNSLRMYIEDSPSAAEVVNSLPLSQKAQAQATDFINNLLSLHQTDFEQIQGYIETFESEVLTDTAYSEEEKNILLSVTAIERYSAYYRKKPKDKDWDLLIGNIVAGAQGAAFDAATAILYSVSVEVALHKSI